MILEAIIIKKAIKYNNKKKYLINSINAKMYINYIIIMLLK